MPHIYLANWLICKAVTVNGCRFGILRIKLDMLEAFCALFQDLRCETRSSTFLLQINLECTEINFCFVTKYSAIYDLQSRNIEKSVWERSTLISGKLGKLGIEKIMNLLFCEVKKREYRKILISGIPQTGKPGNLFQLDEI